MCYVCNQIKNMAIKRILTGIIVFTYVLLSTQCKHKPDLTIDNIIIPEDPTQLHTCDPDTVYFQNDVLPLLISSCASSKCHDAETAEEGIILIDYLSVMQTGKIKPGDPNDSELYEKIIDDDPEERMPPLPKDALTPEQQDIIQIWIEQGAKNNSCDSDCDTLNVTFSGTVWPTLEKNCKGCHSGENPEGEIPITNYNDIVLLANNGSLLGAISHDLGYVPMPENGQKLIECKITEIKIWIANGAQDD